MPAISWRQAMGTTATRGTRKGGKERGERKGKRRGEKGRKSLARASSLKWFGERWHAKLESSVSPSPLWLHIKRNREKFFLTKINGAQGTPRSLNNTDYLDGDSPHSELVDCAAVERCHIFGGLVSIVCVHPRVRAPLVDWLVLYGVFNDASVGVLRGLPLHLDGWHR